ncbi:competence type IV pilus minor pilin ComGF [Ornithinibacillus scapharcae]|uniref:competence type IV pilus minor pilin ComGF n=1 Tax=Ornithinibacillus scapharcae TaxID=1147159 RepID=UPI000225B0F4|nr:ComGF family competence protein [Ornithinibacillus scapharcae]
MGFRSERGFTFFTLLLIITVLIICIPIYGVIIRAIPDKSYDQEISIQQFFHFLQQECNKSTTVYSEKHQILMISPGGERVSFEQYGNLIRRQVNKLGHEIYLRDIKNWSIIPVTNGLRIQITSIKGEQYEKTIQYQSS